MDLKELIGQHGNSVALVYKKMGVSDEVTPESILNYASKYGQKFINAVAKQAEADEVAYLNFSGDATSLLPPGFSEAVKKRAEKVTLGNVTVKSRPKKKTGEKIKNTLNDALDLFVKGAGAIATIKGNKGTGADNPGGGIYSPVDTGTPEPKKKINYWLIAGIIIIIVLILVLVFKKKSK